MKKIAICLLALLTGIALVQCKKNPPEQPYNPVEKVEVTNVTLEPTTLELEVGQSSEPLRATVEPENATNKAVTFSIDKPTVALVDSATGVVTAIAEGEAVVTVTADGGFTAQCEVSVVPVSTVVPVAGVSLPATIELELNERRTLEPVFDPADATNKNVRWNSSAPATVSVTEDGEIKALAVGGPVTITVTTEDGNFPATCSVTVKSPTVTGEGDMSNIHWKLMSSGELTLSGTGPMPNFSFFAMNTPWFDLNPVRVAIIEEGITSIGESAFSEHPERPGRPQALEKVTIPSTVTSIGMYAFGGCTRLEGVTIPDSVTDISHSAFADCNRMTYANIGTGVRTLGNGAFENCRSLTSLVFADGLTEIGDYCFRLCVGLTEFTIPGTVTEIRTFPFEACEKLKTITIGNGVREITKNVFSMCNGLESVVIPDSVEVLAGDCFRDCPNLRSVTIPGNVTSIGSYAFSGCGKLETVTFTGTVETLAEHSFSGSGIKNINLSGVKNIGANAFFGCGELLSVTVANSVTSMGSAAFSKCGKLASVTIGSGLTELPSFAFSQTKITSITIPGTIRAIGQQAFEECTLLTSVTIQEGVETIRNGAFKWCENLPKMVLANSVKMVETLAFQNCYALTEFTFGSGFQMLNSLVFINCGRLMTVRVLATTPPTLEAGVGLSHFGADGDTLYVPAGTRTAYQNSSWGREFTTITEM
jgi:hypothetical protein